MKICFTASGGGHIKQLLQLKNLMRKYSNFFVTFKNPGSSGMVTAELSKNHKIYFTINPGSRQWPYRNPFRHLFNLIEAFIIILKNKPDIIITNGSGVSFGCLLVGKLFGKKTIFIETFSRINRPSPFGYFANKLSDLTIVQWKPLLAHLPGSVYGGPIFNLLPNKKNENERTQGHIFVVLGTRGEDFSRLLKKIDELILDGSIKEQVIAQIGHTKYDSDNFETFDFCSRDEFESYLKESKLVINGNGVGTITSALSYNKPIILAPRLFELGEIAIENLDIATEFDKAGLLKTVFKMEHLKEAIYNVKKPVLEGNFGDNKIEDIIEKQIFNWSYPDKKTALE